MNFSNNFKCMKEKDFLLNFNYSNIFTYLNYSTYWSNLIIKICWKITKDLYQSLKHILTLKNKLNFIKKIALSYKKKF